MPKKQPRNAFYFFMLDFKEQQRKQGIMYANLNEVSQAAGPSWTAAPPAVRSKFEGIAKAEKAKTNVPEMKFTAQGVSLAELQNAERERRAAIEAERNYIANFVKQKSFDNSILDEDIFLMDVNSYCQAGAHYLIGEFAFLRMSLRDGIKDCYSEIVNPGSVPIGYMLDVKLGAKELGLAMPDSSEPRADYVRVLATALDFLRRAGPAARPPPLYTMPDKVAPCADFIQQLCSCTAEDESQFRVYQLDTLFYQLMQGHEGFPKESLALAQLKKDPFKYSVGLACKEHEAADKAVECSAGRARRWAYTVLDLAAPRRDLRPLPGRHLPADFDLDSILQYKESRRAAPGASVAGPAPAADSTLDCSLDSSLNSWTERKRTHVPLRMPKADYSMEVRAAPELSLSSEVEFPALASAGRGRGRSLAGAFDRMKM